jgi:hypothetical protein
VLQGCQLIGNHRALAFIQLPSVKIQGNDKRNKRAFTIPLTVRRIDAKLFARLET